MKILFYISSSVLILGVLLKILHLPFANEALIIGFCSTVAFGLLGTGLPNRRKSAKSEPGMLLKIFTTVFAIVVGAGAVLKVLHLPFGNEALIAGAIGSVVCGLIQVFQKNDSEDDDSDAL